MLLQLISGLEGFLTIAWGSRSTHTPHVNVGNLKPFKQISEEYQLLGFLLSFSLLPCCTGICLHLIDYVVVCKSRKKERDISQCIKTKYLHIISPSIKPRWLLSWIQLISYWLSVGPLTFVWVHVDLSSRHARVKHRWSDVINMASVFGSHKGHGAGVLFHHSLGALMCSSRLSSGLYEGEEGSLFPPCLKSFFFKQGVAIGKCWNNGGHGE